MNSRQPQKDPAARPAEIPERAAAQASRRIFRAAAGAAAVLAALVPSSPSPGAMLGAHQDALASNPCKVCHDTAAGAPALRGWAGTIAASPAGGWGTKEISMLCYGCHDSGGGYLSTNANTQEFNAFDDLNGSHSYTVSGAPKEPEGSPQGSLYQSVASSGLPYSANPQLECTSCHNVHVASIRPFLQVRSYRALCEECHGGRGNDAAATRATAGFSRAYSTHPTLVSVNGPSGGRNMMIAGTSMDGRMSVATPAAPGYVLGGHLDDGTFQPVGDSGQVNCQTCHAVHGPAAGTAGLIDLLSIENATENAGVGIGSAICEGCHYGGAAGDGGIAGAGVGVTPVVLASGEWPDHPVDAEGNRAFIPAGVVIPVNWTNGVTANGDRGAQPFLASGAPACSSCHDTHGGMADTPLLRGPTAGVVSGNPWGFSYDDWCFVCHTLAQIVPAGHHSTINSLSVASGGPIDSQLGCGDCHGPLGQTNWTAHNGFWAFVLAVSAADSAFCEACHSPLDPTDLVSPALKGQTFNEAGTVFPASHGTLDRGSASHYLGLDSGEFPGVVPKLDGWSSGFFSEYGPTRAGAGGGEIAPSGVGDDTAVIICESCHNITYNDGRANPGSYSSALKAGWESNLLLEPYADDPPGAGSGGGPNAVTSDLCTGCHTASGNHHPLTGDTVSLSGLLLRTGGGSFADQTAGPTTGGAAPGTLSYPDGNALDCDSCHRPHDAADESTVIGAQHGAMTSGDGEPTYHILEVDGANHAYTPAVCHECHEK